MEPILETISVSKSFGNALAVKDVSLSIAAGQFFSLLGPSGCGKTTLLRMVAGFEAPSSGKVFICNTDMTGVPPYRRPVNMVFQSYALFPHLTVFENIAFGLRVGRQCGSAEVSGRVNQALDLVHLSGLADRYPAQISGGQQQRIALARALVNKPAVLLLDEPLSALDAKIRQEMQAELSRLQREIGITFLMVTHDQSEALALSNQIAVFRQGILEQVGSPQEIYQNPKTSFVASFIGQNNIMTGLLLESNLRFSRVKVTDNLTLWVKRAGYGVSATVTVWAKKQSVLLHDQGCSVTNSLTEEPINWFEAVITNRAYQGDATDYQLRVNGSLNLKASVPNDLQKSFQLGQTVNVCLPAAQVSILPESA